MLPWMYTTGRFSRLASAGVWTTGRDSTTMGMSFPCEVWPSEPTYTSGEDCRRESRNAMTSAYVEVSVKLVRSGRVSGWRRDRSPGGYAENGCVPEAAVSFVCDAPVLAHAATMPRLI